MSNPYHVDAPPPAEKIEKTQLERVQKGALRRYHNMMGHVKFPPAPPTAHGDETTLDYKLRALTALQGWDRLIPFEMCGLKDDNMVHARLCFETMYIYDIEDMLIVFGDVPNMLLRRMGLTEHTILCLRDTWCILERIAQEDPNGVSLAFLLRAQDKSARITPAMVKKGGNFDEDEIDLVIEELARIGVEHVGDLPDMRYLERFSDMKVTQYLSRRIVWLSVHAQVFTKRIDVYNKKIQEQKLKYNVL